MNEDLEPIVEAVQKQLEQSAEIARSRAVAKITLESERLIDELLIIIYAPDVDARVKLSAIGMLLDRGVPKLAVDNKKSEIVEESKTRKKIQEEIRLMMREDDDDDGGSGALVRR